MGKKVTIKHKYGETTFGNLYLLQYDLTSLLYDENRNNFMRFLHRSTYNLRRILSFVAPDWTEPISIALSIVENRTIEHLRRRTNANIQQNT